jgi:adenine-specific DNA-methyltransferase
MQNILNELKISLQKSSKFNVNGELSYNLLLENALKLDPELLAILLENEALRRHFFVDVGNIQVFDKDKFAQFISNKELLRDSYTSFKNKIGLTTKEHYISQTNEVVLSFPFKDCILEGDQSNPKDGRNEIFWNEVLAPDDIDRLLDYKVLTGFQYINERGSSIPNTIKETDNLFIRGNNLMVISSLKARFRGKVKLIYIDPPYNTGGDDFKYNDRFNHSSWLVFMKNRLEIARDLLSDSGTIFVQVDDNEVFYLKILMDEIFGSSPKGKKNFVQMVEVKSNEGAANESQNPFMPKMCEYILIYSKNYDKRKYKPIWVKSDVDSAYNKIILNPEEKDFTKWKIGSVNHEFSKQFIDPSVKDENQFYDFVFRNAGRIFETINPKFPGNDLKEAMIKSIENTWTVYKREKLDDIYCYKGRMVRFYSKNIHTDINGEEVLSKELGSLWTDIAWTGIAKEGGVKLKSGKKPEKLLRRIIEMATEPGDIVLDFYSGSGTTAAVAHKMKRQYIAVEQLDYGENDTLQRLKNVIHGDATGISNDVGWTGGGSFIYMELMKLNAKFVDWLKEAESFEIVKEIWGKIKENGFINYQVDKNDVDLESEDFRKLNLDTQKRLILEILDKNQLYVNFSEINDVYYNVSEGEIKLNKEMYRE